MARAKRDVHLVTKEGLKKLQDELEYRTTTKKEELKNTLDKMRQMGDLSENDGYTLAISDFQTNEFEIEKLKDLISKSKVAANTPNGIIELGDTVTLKDEGGKEFTYSLVGEDEADLLNKKISYKSPLGASIMGKKKGSTFKITTPRGDVKYTVVSVKG